MKITLTFGRKVKRVFTKKYFYEKPPIKKGEIMKNYSLKLFTLLFMIINGCTDPTSPSEDIIEELVFVACEGNFGASNGSIHISNPMENLTSWKMLATLYNP